MRASIPVSVMIFTLNEQIHLPSCLDALQWYDDIIVVDSFSSDKTQAICEERGVRFFQNAFTGFGNQRNWALDNTTPKHKWLLILDADERVTPELTVELSEIAGKDPAHIGAYQLRRRFYMWGKWLKYSSLYPTWVVRLVRIDRVRYINRGHAETQEVQGEIGNLQHDLIDENLKGIGDWFDRQNRYATKEAEYELDQEKNGLRLSELFSSEPLVKRAALKRLAGRMPARGPNYFFYSYLWRLGFRDGKAGFVFSLMKAWYQSQIAIKKYDNRANQSRTNANRL